MLHQSVHLGVLLVASGSLDLQLLHPKIAHFLELVVDGQEVAGDAGLWPSLDGPQCESADECFLDILSFQRRKFSEPVVLDLVEFVVVLHLRIN